MGREIKKAISELYKRYNDSERKEAWLITERMYPDRDLTAEQLHVLTPEEEKHRKIGALTALTKLNEMINKLNI